MTTKSKKKIVIIGPVYPFKGGISHYTGLLYRALEKEHHVTMMSFSMQYPKILFKREQRDYTNDSFKVDDAQFVLNTANPFSWMKTAARINKIAPDFVIMEWWHPYFAPCFFALTHLIHSKILFICHNVFPHERFPMDRVLTKAVLKKGDSFILHAKAESEELLTIKPDAHYKINVHPTYHAFCFEGMSQETARTRLSLESREKVLLFFGFVRQYKGLHHLLNAMEILKTRGEELRLLVVGDFDGNQEEYQKQMEELGITSMVSVCDGYTPDREVEKYFAATDVVVLPYESATQSGIAQIAYGFGKPVVVTKVGGLPEVVQDGKTGYVIPSCDAKALADAIQRYFFERESIDFAQYIKDAEYEFSWEKMVKTIEDLMES